MLGLIHFMVDAKEFEILSTTNDKSENNKQLRISRFAYILPIIIIIFGTIFSRGEPTVILMSVFVGAFILLIFLLVILIVNLSNDSTVRKFQFNELHLLVYRMNKEIEELKETKN